MVAAIRLGQQGPEVSALGLGCMGLSGAYGSADERQSLATLHAAIESGVSFLDTGDFYGMGHNEMLLAQAIAGRREKVFISVKFGMLRGTTGPVLGFDCRPAAIKTFLAYSLKRLGTEYIDLYQPGRVDPSVPIEETVGAIKELIEAGYVRYLGLSEVPIEAVRRAHAIHPVAALQTEYSLATRGIEASTLPELRDLGIGLVAYGVLSRGLLGGSITTQTDFALTDFRRHAPRFQGENLATNQKLVAKLLQLAADAGLTPAQLAIGWVMAKGDDIVTLVGIKTPQHLAEAIAAANRPLPAEMVAAVEGAIPAESFRGDRYPAAFMANLTQ
jgi:aryl-alcohol dehydrogenase-like predicted oxidoreductase